VSRPRGRATSQPYPLPEGQPERYDSGVPASQQRKEGDLITGTNNKSAIGTLVKRQTRYVVLLDLPEDHGAEKVKDALVKAVSELPAHLARSLTWDQGTEIGRHAEFTIETDVPVYFCNPASPWQRGSNENTNGLLREYFPKGTDLSIYGASTSNPRQHN